MFPELLISGIGRALALQYTAGGAKVCIVGRRQGELEKVKLECLKIQNTGGDNASCLVVAGDCTVPEDMVRVRDEIQKGEFFFYLGEVHRSYWL